MPDYQQGKIYKIVCNTSGLVYIGSTTQKYLSSRLSEHVSHYKRYLNGVSQYYMSSFDVLESGNYKIVLIELYPCNNKDELFREERKHIDNIRCVNKLKPYVFQNERLDRQRIKSLKYYYNNIDIVKDYQTTYRNENREKEKERLKVYRQNNTEKIKNKRHLKYLTMKDEICKNLKEKRRLKKLYLEQLKYYNM